jgi:hypothetical protein
MGGRVGPPYALCGGYTKKRKKKKKEIEIISPQND